MAQILLNFISRKMRSKIVQIGTFKTKIFSHDYKKGKLVKFVVIAFLLILFITVLLVVLSLSSIKTSDNCPLHHKDVGLLTQSLNCGHEGVLLLFNHLVLFASDEYRS